MHISQNENFIKVDVNKFKKNYISILILLYKDKVVNKCTLCIWSEKIYMR